MHQRYLAEVPQERAERWVQLLGLVVVELLLHQACQRSQHLERVPGLVAAPSAALRAPAGYLETLVAFLMDIQVPEEAAAV
jgi:hypothetical protein